MLEKIRDGLKGWLAWVVIAVIGIPLVLTFVGGDSTFTGAGTAISVNGEDIPIVEFQRVLQDRTVARQQETRSQLSPEVEQQLKQETLDGLVLNRAVLQFVHKAGFRVILYFKPAATTRAKSQYKFIQAIPVHIAPGRPNLTLGFRQLTDEVGVALEIQW